MIKVGGICWTKFVNDLQKKLPTKACHAPHNAIKKKI